MLEKKGRARKSKAPRSISPKEKREFQSLLTDVGNRIRTLRLDRNLSQEEMDEYGSVLSISTLQGIEAGRRNPTLLTLFLIAKRLKLNLRDLL